MTACGDFRWVGKSAAALLLAILVAGCGDKGNGQTAGKAPPEAAPQGEPAFLTFERADLATAGLGIDGLRGAPPEPADPAAPTADELWRLAVYNNYRALVDISEGGGYGRLYGPAAGDLPVPGTEYWALGRLPNGATHVMVLQVPSTFPGDRPCLVATPASGSRGPLGGIGTGGDWGLRHGCAVVYTDKGAGPWMTNLGDGEAFAITGVRGEPGELSIVEPFSARAWPGVDDVAVKHAHSGHNPEAHWGAMVLDSIRFALERLDAGHREDGARRYEGDAVLVLAASVSNGGGAVLAAAEADEAGLIDGVVASEPNVYVAPDEPLTFAEGGGEGVLGARPLYDYATHAALYGPCAALSPRFSDAPMAGNLAMLQGLLAARCKGLAEAGLVEKGDVESMARSAYQAMLDHGLHPEAADAQPANTLINIWALVGGVYANAYGRFEPTERVCGLGFRAFDADNQATTPDPARTARLFATSSGVPPVGGIELAAVDGEKATKLIFAASQVVGGPAYGLDQVRCLRGLWTGDDPRAGRVQDGIRATALTGDLGGTPAIIVHGRSDGLVWVNHSARAYYAANRLAEGEGSNLRYVEVTNAQHFDTLLGFPGFAARFVPLHLYFERALDRMHAHLTDGGALPPSQVVRTTPRGGDDGTVPLAPEHVPPIDDTGHAEVIQWQNGTLRIPR